MSFIEILWRQRPIKIEYQWVGVTSKEAPILVELGRIYKKMGDINNALICFN